MLYNMSGIKENFKILEINSKYCLKSKCFTLKHDPL